MILRDGIRRHTTCLRHIGSWRRDPGHISPDYHFGSLTFTNPRRRGVEVLPEPEPHSWTGVLGLADFPFEEIIHCEDWNVCVTSVQSGGVTRHVDSHAQTMCGGSRGGQVIHNLLN